MKQTIYFCTLLDLPRLQDTFANAVAVKQTCQKLKWLTTKERTVFILKVVDSVRKLCRLILSGGFYSCASQA